MRPTAFTFAATAFALAALATSPASAEGLAGKSVEARYHVSIKLCKRATGKCIAGQPSSYHTRIYVGRDGKMYDYSATKSATGDVYSRGRWKGNIKLDHGPGKVTMSFKRPDYVVEFVMATSGGKCRVTTYLSKGANLYNDQSQISASNCRVFDGNAFAN